MGEGGFIVLFVALCHQRFAIGQLLKSCDQLLLGELLFRDLFVKPLESAVHFGLKSVDNRLIDVVFEAFLAEGFLNVLYSHSLRVHANRLTE